MLKSTHPAVGVPTRKNVPLIAFFLALTSCQGGYQPSPELMIDEEVAPDGAYHVHPGEDIQPHLELAARDPVHKKVKVHAGTYRPRRHGQALIWFSQRHDGITLEALGEVILTAANPGIADRSAASFPAVVNHVVYFGDLISEDTVLRGFKITGARGYVTTADEPEPIQPTIHNPRLQKKLFFYADGGGIKIFGRSYPTIENVEVEGNYAGPCGGGVSIEQRGYNRKAVVFRNSVFRNNRSQITGSGVDVLDGSAAIFENCLFVGNVSNTGIDTIGVPFPFNKKHGSGALTVFHNSRVHVSNSTFTGNWNGVDDKGSGSTYIRTIFWQNTRAGGVLNTSRYELDIRDSRGVSACWINGEVDDPRQTIDADINVLDAPDPMFDERYQPRAKAYANVGYRPLQQEAPESQSSH